MLVINLATSSIIKTICSRAARVPAVLCFFLFFLSCADGHNPYNKGSGQDHISAAELYHLESAPNAGEGFSSDSGYPFAGQTGAAAGPSQQTGAAARQTGSSLSFGSEAAAGPALVKHDRQRIKRFLANQALAEEDSLIPGQLSPQYDEEIKSQVQTLLEEEGLLRVREPGGLDDGLHDLSNQFLVQVAGERIKNFILQEFLREHPANTYFEDGSFKSLIDRLRGVLSQKQEKKSWVLEMISNNSDSQARLADGSEQFFGQEFYVIKEGSGEEGPLLIEMPKMPKLASWNNYVTISPQQRILMESEKYDRIIRALKAADARAIGVNIYQNFNFSGMMNLSRFVKEKGIDVYVLGYCNLTCSNYLLPAAKNIHIGHAGAIMYGGMVSAFVKKNLDDALIKNPPRQTNRQFQRDSVPKLFAHLKSADSAGALSALYQNSGRGAPFARSLGMRLEDESLKDALSEGFASRDRQAVFGFLRSYGRSLQDRVLNHFEHNRAAEEAFFNDIFVNAAAPAAKYSYIDFLGVTVNITGYRKTTYEKNLRKLFKINRAINFEGSYFGFAAEEEDRPRYVFPSVKILREIGLNISSGKNYEENLYITYKDNYSSNVARVDGDDIINCRFFNGFFEGDLFEGTEREGIKAYGMGHLQECLRKTDE